MKSRDIWNLWFESLSWCVSNGLEILDLSNARLSGKLTDELGQFKNPVILSLGNNSILGPIPWSIGNLSSLRSLNLETNQINGTLPQSFGHLSKLESLNIYSNMLEGVVSEVHFTNLMRLTKLFASQNWLTLEVSDNWTPPFQVNNLVLGSWNFGPKFPSWLCSQEQLLILDISNTGILDAVPPFILEPVFPAYVSKSLSQSDLWRDSKYLNDFVLFFNNWYEFK